MRYRGLDFPGVRDVARCLRAENDFLRRNFTREQRVSEDGEPEVCGDVRLNVQDDGSWNVYFGDSSYDQDHRGYWGCSSLDGEPFNSLALARQLIDDCKEHYAQVKED